MLSRLARGEVVVGDGGWGTLLMARGLVPGRAPETVVLERPELISEIAGRYLEAGAELLTTNSFGGSPLRLAQAGLADRVEEVNREAAAVLRRVAAGRALVSGSVGPCGQLLAPLGEADPGEVEEGFRRQVAALVEGGADLICVETMTDLEEATRAVRAARGVAPALPVMASMTFDATPRGFFTVMGVSVEQAVRGLAEAGANVVGSNCGHGVEQMIGIAEAMGRATELPILIQANAGLPVVRGDEIVYPDGPERFAAGCERLLELGVSVVGGCCGTTPDHIRALRRLVDRRRGSPSARDEGGSVDP